MAVVAVRPLEDGDLDALSEQRRGPLSVWMAAFTPQDRDDRNAFDAHMTRVRSSPDITMRAVTCDGRLAESIASSPDGGQAEVTYWIDRPAWGKGIATRALALLLDLVTARPMYAVPPATMPVHSASFTMRLQGSRDQPATLRLQTGWDDRGGRSQPRGTPNPLPGGTGDRRPELARQRPVVAGCRSA